MHLELVYYHKKQAFSWIPLYLLMPSVRHIGFTGTREGLSTFQKRTLYELLNSFDHIIFHHGDDQGADANAHDIADDLAISIEVHPPSNDKRRACKVGKIVHSPKPYLERNKDIVNTSDLLIACPKTKNEELRSGTWSTVRYAKKINVPYIIIPPRL